jgi:hypothetical protein
MLTFWVNSALRYGFRFALRQAHNKASAYSGRYVGSRFDWGDILT